MNSTTKGFIFLIFFAFITSVVFPQDIPSDQWFWVKSGLNKGKNKQGCWDVSGHPKEIKPGETHNVKVWNIDNGPDRLYRFEKLDNGNYKIFPMHGDPGYCLRYDGKNKGSGSNFYIDKYGAPDSEFRIEYADNGLWRIYSLDGRVVCLENRSSKNGKNVHLWDDHQGASTEWCLEIPGMDKIYEPGKDIPAFNPYLSQGVPSNRWFWVKSVNNKGKDKKGCWDVSGNPKTVKPGETQNIKVWNIDNGDDRKYKFERQANGLYKIYPKHGYPDYCVRYDGNNNGNGANFYIDKAGAPNTEFKLVYLNNATWRIYTPDNRIVCLQGRSSKNGSNVHMWEEHGGAGTAWCLEIPGKNKFYEPAEVTGLKYIIPGSLTGKNSARLVADIDNTYEEISKVEQKFHKLNGPLNKAKDILDKTKVISKRLDKLDNRVSRAHGALSAFTKIPVIGAPVTALTVSLNMAKKNIGRANDKVQDFEKPVLRPAADNFNALSGASSNLETKLFSLKAELADIKAKYIASAACVNSMNNNTVKGSFEKKSENLSARLDDVNKQLGRVNSGISKVEKVAVSIAKMDGPLKKVDKGIKKIDKAFSKTDKAAKEINKVLNKRFKKKKFGVGIDISLKKVLTGGKVGKWAAKLVNKWADKLMKSLMKKLKIKIPNVAGIEELKREVNNLKNNLNGITESAKIVKESCALVDKAKLDLKQKLADCAGECGGQSAMGG